MFRQGAAGTSVDDVRRAAGASGSQMTHYFQDKQSLVRAVTAKRADDLAAFHQQPGLGSLGSLQALDRWAELCSARAKQLNCEGGCRLGSLVGQLAETDPKPAPTSPRASPPQPPTAAAPIDT
jgi:TetR/AcrR family transcriptional repressor of nem operon